MASYRKFGVAVVGEFLSHPSLASEGSFVEPAKRAKAALRMNE